MVINKHQCLLVSRRAASNFRSHSSNYFKRQRCGKSSFDGLNDFASSLCPSPRYRLPSRQLRAGVGR